MCSCFVDVCMSGVIFVCLYVCNCFHMLWHEWKILLMCRLCTYEHGTARNGKMCWRKWSLLKLRLESNQFLKSHIFIIILSDVLSNFSLNSKSLIWSNQKIVSVLSTLIVYIYYFQSIFNTKSLLPPPHLHRQKVIDLYFHGMLIQYRTFYTDQHDNTILIHYQTHQWDDISLQHCTVTAYTYNCVMQCD